MCYNSPKHTQDKPLRTPSDLKPPSLSPSHIDPPCQPVTHHVIPSVDIDIYFLDLKMPCPMSYRRSRIRIRQSQERRHDDDNAGHRAHRRAQGQSDQRPCRDQEKWGHMDIWESCRWWWQVRCAERPQYVLRNTMNMAMPPTRGVHCVWWRTVILRCPMGITCSRRRFHTTPHQTSSTNLRNPTH